MARTVGDIMVRTLLTINEEDNLAGLAAGMEEYHLRHLPVVSGKKLVGLITHRDILRFSMSDLERPALAGEVHKRAKENTFAASVMTRDLTTVREDTPLLQAVRLILANRFGCLPVVDDEMNLVGLITEHDLLRELASELQQEAVAEISESLKP